jgi:hypothetical protein
VEWPIGQVISGADRAIARLVSQSWKSDRQSVNSEFPSFAAEIVLGSQSRPKSSCSAVGQNERFGVTATERKFGETIAATRLDPSVVQPKREGRFFLFESAVTI